MLETQKSGNKASSREIGLNIRTLASPKVGQDQVSGGASVLCLHAEFFTLGTTFLKSLNYTFKRNNCQYSFKSFGKLASSTKIPISTSMYAISAKVSIQRIYNTWKRYFTNITFCNYHRLPTIITTYDDFKF